MQIRKKRGAEETAVWTDTPVDSGYEQRILSENEIPGLCRLRIRNTDGERVCCYRTAGLVSLREKGSRPDTALLLQILEALQRQKDELTLWLIGEDCLLLDPDLVFFDAEGKVLFCAMPGGCATLGEQLDGLLPFFEAEGDRAEPGSGTLSAGEAERLRALCTGEPDLARMAETLREEKDEGREAALPAWVEQEDRSTRRRERLRKALRGLQRAGFLLMPLLGIGVEILLFYSGRLSGFSLWIRCGIYGVTAVFFAMLTMLLREAGVRRGKSAAEALEELPPPEEELPPIAIDDTLEYGQELAEDEPGYLSRGETVLLSDLTAADRARTILISLDPEARGNLYLGAAACRIGKSGGGAQVQPESSYLSRDHAVIDTSGDGCRIRDEGSTNGTFLNGDRLMPYQWYPVQEGDEIRFADAAYRYRRGGAEGAPDDWTCPENVI